MLFLIAPVDTYYRGDCWSLLPSVGQCWVAVQLLCRCVVRESAWRTSTSMSLSKLLLHFLKS